MSRQRPFNDASIDHAPPDVLGGGRRHRGTCPVGHSHERLQASPFDRIVPHCPKPPHFAPKAKSVISLFMNGGTSHVDTFDPKPELAKRNGEARPRA